MSEVISKDRVLIVPSYTDNELNLLKDSKTKSQVKSPISYYFQVMEIDYTPRMPVYEDFESAQGKIGIEKACDEFAKLEFSVAVYQQMRAGTDKIEFDSSTKKDVRSALSVPGSELNETVVDTSTLVGTGNADDAWGTTSDYIELRRNFFTYLLGRPLTVVSALFPPIAIGYITDLNYTMEEGSEDAVYKITISEYLSG